MPKPTVIIHSFDEENLEAKCRAREKRERIDYLKAALSANDKSEDLSRRLEELTHRQAKRETEHLRETEWLRVKCRGLWAAVCALLLILAALVCQMERIGR